MAIITVRHLFKKKKKKNCNKLITVSFAFNFYINIIRIRPLLNVRTTHNAAAGAIERRKYVCVCVRVWRAAAHLVTHTHIHTWTRTRICVRECGRGPGRRRGVSAHTYTTTRGTQGRWPWDTTSIGPGECLYNNIIILSDVCTDNNNNNIYVSHHDDDDFRVKWCRRRPNSRWGRWYEM